jgi:hypothetical protein
MRSMLRRMKYLVIVASLAVMAVFLAPASAQHFEDGSTKVCGALIGGQVNCTLSIKIQDDLDGGVFEGDDIIVTLGPGTTGATYASAAFDSGCGGAAVTVDDATHLSVDPDASPVDDCTIVVEEVLNATAAGEVCQTLDNNDNDPPVTVCANILPGPTNAETDCKKGAWESWGVFKNQGDCVSYIATNGRNAPAGA